MNSMTGYGRGEAEAGGVSIVVEVRSVNSRYRDVHFRAPREYAAIEPRVKALLKERFARGRLDVTVHRQSATSGGRVRLDSGLAAQYHRALTELAGLVGGEATLAMVAQSPGVITVSEAAVDVSEEWPAVEAAMVAAFDALAAMRGVEGGALRADLSTHLVRLTELCQRAESEAEIGDQAAVMLSERLGRLMAQAGAQVDPQRLIQEAAVLVDKADVSEELARLDSHLQQLRAALDLDEPVGRRMDFLAQEIHREINTCGSKSSGVALSEIVVEMKSTLERIREQVANAE